MFFAINQVVDIVHRGYLPQWIFIPGGNTGAAVVNRSGTHI